MCPFFEWISIYRVKGSDKHMNEISQLSVVCTHITHDASGKAKETKRRFTNLNTKATDSEIRSFVNIIAHLINETFDKVEVVKTQVLA